MKTLILLCIYNSFYQSVDIANRIYELLREKNMTQREFAELMGKRESEISRLADDLPGLPWKVLNICVCIFKFKKI